MSELQVALLVIGCGVIVAVYVFGRWQQTKYRQRFSATFKSDRTDALYNDNVPGRESRNQPSEISSFVDLSAGVASSATSMLDESCSLLDTRTDFIIELTLDEPGPAAVLDGLWQRKFDFRKLVQVCGQALVTGEWERVIADPSTGLRAGNQALYGRFRIALQLVDRSGAISEAKLADFQDLVLGIAKHIKADTTVPDIRETYHHAVELDAFCTEVDQMAGVNLVSQGERMLTGGDIAQAADSQGMNLESDGAFHLLDTQGHSLFSLINQDNRPFQHHTLETFSTPGITLLLDVPRVENPALHFDQMIRVAHELARALQVNVVDDHGVMLSDINLAGIRQRIVEVEDKMCDHGITPGNAQARRLFS